MSLPHNTNHGDEELERYVLGLLPDEATERLDEASIADDEVAARLRNVETDLLDSYIRGQLAGPTLERFEAYYLMSPRRREKLRVAARFVRALDRSVPRERMRWNERIARPIRVAGFVAAAALVVVVSGVIFSPPVRPLDKPAPATSSTRAVSPPAQVVEQPVPGERAAAEAAAGPRDTNRAVPQEAIVSLVLFPPTRSLAPIPTLAIPAGADRVAFELQLESNDFSRYRVGLKNPATNDILWRSDWIPARATGDQASVSAVVPASLLAPQHYALDLTARSVDGRVEVMGSYIVRITKP